MKVAAIFIGCLTAFAGGWGGMLLASTFMHKAGAGWELSRFAVLSIGIAALLGLLAGGFIVRSISRMP